MNAQDVLIVIQKLRDSAQNLSKDIDPEDAREQTQGDLRDLSVGFQQLQKMFATLDKEQKAKIQGEVKELMEGKQNFLEYARDVRAILAEVRKKAEVDEEVKQKIEENIPEQHKDQGTASFFTKITDCLEEFKNWSGKQAPR